MCDDVGVYCAKISAGVKEARLSQYCKSKSLMGAVLLVFQQLTNVGI